jgi:hypothetical protein
MGPLYNLVSRPPGHMAEHNCLVNCKCCRGSRAKSGWRILSRESLYATGVGTMTPAEIDTRLARDTDNELHIIAFLEYCLNGHGGRVQSG